MASSLYKMSTSISLCLPVLPAQCTHIACILEDTQRSVKNGMQRIAYRSLRVEKGTQKQAEEFPCDEGIIPNTFITRSLQQYEYTVFPSKAKGRGASSDSPGHPNPDATGHHRRDDPSAEARFWSRKSRPSSDGQ